VGGAFTASGSLSINEMPGSATPGTVGLVVGGNLSLAGGQLDNTNSGNAWVGGNVSSSSYFNFEHDLNYVGTLTNTNIVVGGATNKIGSGAMPVNFSSAATSLVQLSSTLAAEATNGTVAVNGSTYTLTATGCTICVFDLTSGTFTNSAINISAPSGATVVINVSGTSDSYTNGSINYTGGATANDTLFNFGSAATLTTTGMTIYGSVLAPVATFTGTNGSIDGELIANSVTGETAELESGDIFSGNLGSVATPEPSTWLLMAIALIPCGLRRARRVAPSKP
jgi:choice-of-anchor A domain-containing protein